MNKIMAFTSLAILAACGPRDRCNAPPQPKLMSVRDMSLTDKANALGVPPDRVPGQPQRASSFEALMQGSNESAAADSSYESFVEHKNAVLRRDYCVENEAYKARNMSDDMNTIGKAVMATCHSDEEEEILAALLKYRNCAAGR